MVATGNISALSEIFLLTDWRSASTSEAICPQIAAPAVQFVFLKLVRAEPCAMIPKSAEKFHLLPLAMALPQPIPIYGATLLNLTEPSKLPAEAVL